MAETALHLALRKISIASGTDDDDSVILIESFRSRLRRIESEVRMICCFLDQHETRYSNNQVLVSWIAEARKLGHRVEETVDVHIYRLFRPAWFTRLLPSFVLWTNNPIEMRYRAFIGMIELEEELQHLSKMKKLWIQEANDPEPGYIPSISETTKVSYQKLLSDFTIKEPKWFNVERPELSRLLKRIDGDVARQVVAVWGPAGSGKTTLVRSVYEQQRKHFDCWAWISMSTGASAKDILPDDGANVQRPAESLRLDDLRLDHDIDREPLKHLAEALARGCLSEKRFLIVFDGVNIKDGISEVRDKIQPRSRIIVVTRIPQVATEVDETPIKLEDLEDDKALELFRRVVFGKEPDITDDLWNDANAEEICHKCKGLPQVIISLGASLSLKQNKQSTFDQVKRQLEWVSKNNSILDDASKCLYVAYINLPKHLKVCLLYCGIFPAGHLLLRENLVRLMVAEGFTEKQRPSEVDEEIAEGYLMELTRWRFLHLVDTDDLGRVTSWRMPTIVHDLVRSISRKEGFGIAPDDVELAHTDTDVRCLFISKYPEDIRSLTELTHMRTLVTGESADEEDPPIAKSLPQNAVVYFLEKLSSKTYTIITVLDLQGSTLQKLPASIGRLFNLRYLGLRKTKIQYLPNSMGRLHNMQTLDLESSNRIILPDWNGGLARLRHLLARHFIDEGNRGKILMGMIVPSLERMTELQTLETVEAGEKFVNSVDKLTQLRSLRVSNVNSKSWRKLLSKMSELCSLTSFAVIAKDNEVLDLSGDRIEQLKTLELSCCKLGKDPIKSLSKKFPNLVSLSLYKVSGISELIFQDDYFPELRILNLRGMGDVKQLQIPVGALASLEVLRVEGLTELNVDTVGQLDKIRSIKKCFFPQLRDRLETTNVPESSSRAAQQ